MAGQMPEQVSEILDDLRKGHLTLKAADPEFSPVFDRLGRRLYTGLHGLGDGDRRIVRGGQREGLLGVARRADARVRGVSGHGSHPPRLVESARAATLNSRSVPFATADRWLDCDSLRPSAT